ncbi:hypothetical protein Hgul01_00820 [Herpetosiphon gulosus]|uniref:Uncharacterized protein n=1 Tax=Herpetosiphon gulosus TaxID=1973496 RepID=A0ABP9WWT2_9CHLR
MWDKRFGMKPFVQFVQSVAKNLTFVLFVDQASTWNQNTTCLERPLELLVAILSLHTLIAALLWFGSIRAVGRLVNVGLYQPASTAFKKKPINAKTPQLRGSSERREEKEMTPSIGHCS